MAKEINRAGATTFYAVDHRRPLHTKNRQFFGILLTVHQLSIPSDSSNYGFRKYPIAHVEKVFFFLNIQIRCVKRATKIFKDVLFLLHLERKGTYNFQKTYFITI